VENRSGCSSPDIVVVNDQPVTGTLTGQWSNAEVVNGIGWPGLVGTYRVDFRVPGDVAAGTASMQLSAAWIDGPQVQIAVQ
jgi:uncharacterized protein (TIGR03437 family)